MVIRVKSITILNRSFGGDIIHLHLDLPEGCWPYKGDATADMKVAKDTAEEYVKKNFSEIKPVIIKE